MRIFQTNLWNTKKCLLESAKELTKGEDEIQICVKIYKSYHDNFMVPMTLPRKNRALYQYDPTQKELRDLNIGYGLSATHFIFGPLN